MNYGKPGKTVARLSAVGLRCMEMSDFYHRRKMNGRERIAAIRRPIELGVTAPVRTALLSLSPPSEPR